jgi:Predicted membrane protein (DUF2207) C-terminal domain
MIVIAADAFEPGWIEAATAFLPALLILLVTVARYGPDEPVVYDREYEQSPPTNTPPALAAPLLRRSTTPGSDEFTATLFDLIRRGYFRATPNPDTTDLLLALGDPDVALAPFEIPVAAIFESLIRKGPARLSRLGGSLGGVPENIVRFDLFRQTVESEIKARKWYTFTAARVLLFSSIGLFAFGMTAGWVVFSVSKTAEAYFGLATIVGAGLLFQASWIAKLVRWRRRSADGRMEYERWAAFRRYLEDFPRLRDTPAAALDLWERYLVYAIAFGIAHQVLAGAGLYRLEQLSSSPIFWLGLSAGGGAAYPDVGEALARRRRLGTPAG